LAKDIFTALGLMSGTSMDAIDVALIRTDGVRIAEPVASAGFPLDERARALLRRAMEEARMLTARDARPGILRAAEDAVTAAHVHAVRAFLEEMPAGGAEIDVIGFHGQTVLHRPEAGLTVQLGDGATLARRTGIPVVWDMRAADVAAGGQGAPLVPAYHRILSRRVPQSPVAFVNIGGISNVTWVNDDGRMLAFDCGPGNALLDDWCLRHAGLPRDEDGRLAAAGREHEKILAGWLSSPFFTLPPPKSLDRGDFTSDAVEGLSLEDGAATLARLTARAIARAREWFPHPARLWVITGGGRRNRHLMTLLAEELDAPVVPAEAVHMNGDMMEAECWACLAVRSLKGLPLTFPETTGVPAPCTGGRLSLPDDLREEGT